MLCGFSKGACLALEFAARHARRYGGVVGLSGWLMSPDETARNYAGSLAGTQSFWELVTSIPISSRSECAFLTKSSDA
jgi:alpha-beta hydrolase superfamily lysophospholipase